MDDTKAGESVCDQCVFGLKSSKLDGQRTKNATRFMINATLKNLMFQLNVKRPHANTQDTHVHIEGAVGGQKRSQTAQTVQGHLESILHELRTQ